MVFKLKTSDELEVFESLQGADQGAVCSSHLADEIIFYRFSEARLDFRPNFLIFFYILPEGTPESAFHLLGQTTCCAAAIDVDFAFFEESFLDCLNTLL